MKSFLRFVEWFSNSLAVIAGIGLTFMMLLTVCDVILRYLGKPIPGTYELVAFSGVVVIGFAISYTSWAKAHVYVDFVIMSLTRKSRGTIQLITRGLSIAFFAMLGVCLILDGFSMYSTGEVSPTLKFPFYPIALGLGVCAFTQCLVLVGDIMRILGGQYE
jgi:TRAP-type C4-dicarboxylate transport system permease small subunit